MHEQHREWFALKQSSPRAQFGNAMKIIDQLSTRKEIEILGPKFSGSIESLGDCMAEVQPDRRNYKPVLVLVVLVPAKF
jgi:hypothetical protein